MADHLDLSRHLPKLHGLPVPALRRVKILTPATPNLQKTMDQNTLAIIAVTGIITAVAKETVAITFKMTGNAWKAFRAWRTSTMYLMLIVFALVAMAFSLFVLFLFIGDKTPATKSHVAVMCGYVINLMAYWKMLGTGLNRYRKIKYRERMDALEEELLARVPPTGFYD